MFSSASRYGVAVGLKKCRLSSRAKPSRKIFSQKKYSAVLDGRQDGTAIRSRSFRLRRGECERGTLSHIRKVYPCGYRREQIKEKTLIKPYIQGFLRFLFELIFA